jgi:flagellar assembly protein FliH
MSFSEPAARGALAPQITTFTFEQLETQAHTGLGGADVLSAAWAEAEHVRAVARAEGDAEGRAEGLAQARAEAAPALAALTEAARALEELRDELITKIEHDAAEMALRLAEQIIAGALDVRPERVVDVARSALRRLSDRHRVTILVNPADLELLTPSVDQLQAELGGIDHLDVQADRRIERGGVIARTDSGEIDTTVPAQLQSAREIVAAALSDPDTDLHGDDVDAG